MTFIGWMHRKLRSNNDVFKDFSTCAVGGSCNCISGLASPDPAEYLGDDDLCNNRLSPPVDSDDLFTFAGSGLLTIGTLGFTAVNIPRDDDQEYDVDADSDDDNSTVDGEADDEGAVTPTFTFPTAEVTATPALTFPAPELDQAIGIGKEVGVIEAIAEKDDNTTTEDDLMLVSAELEKVLGGSNATSDVPSARVSFAMGVDCPLQGFLFGSPVSSDVESRLGQRDSCGRRASLGELFMRTRFAEEKVALVAVADSDDGSAGGEREGTRELSKGKGGHKSTVKNHKVKDEKGAAAAGDGMPASSTTKSKFQKILQIFHRKVYPESSILTRNLAKKHRKRRPDSGAGGGGGTDDKLVVRQFIPSLGCCANGAFAASPDNGELNGNKSGHWIKTDADYLVLEL